MKIKKLAVILSLGLCEYVDRLYANWLIRIFFPIINMPQGKNGTEKGEFNSFFSAANN